MESRRGFADEKIRFSVKERRLIPLIEFTEL